MSKTILNKSIQDIKDYVRSLNTPDNKFYKENELVIMSCFSKAMEILKENLPIEQNVTMKFIDAPIGARFKFIGKDVPKHVYVKINAHDDGLVVKWNGNIKGHQSHCCWVDKENGYDFNTEIELI